MQPPRIAFVALFLAGIVSGRADDLAFKVDSTKVSDLQGKAFNLKDASGFGGTAPGFDKAFVPGGTASGWIDHRADIGGRDVYAPDVKMEKAFAVPQTSLFQGASPFTDKAAPFSMADAKLPLDAPMKNFNATVPFADKPYAGPENDRLRQAMAPLLDKESGALGDPDPLHPKRDDALHKQLNASGGAVSPLVTVQDIKVLINKDVAPVPAAGQGVTVK